MSFTDDLLKAEQEAVSIEKSFQNNRINSYAEHIVRAVKKATMHIAKSSGKHQAEGYISSYEGDCSFIDSPERLAINYAFELNHGNLTVKELEQVCNEAENALSGLGFKKAEVRIVKQDLNDIEFHPANIKSIGFCESTLFGLKKKPQKYLLYVSVAW